MTQTTIKYNSGTDPNNKWTTDEYAYDNVDDTNAGQLFEKNTEDETEHFLYNGNPASDLGGTITLVEIGAECWSLSGGISRMVIRPMYGGSTAGTRFQHPTQKIGLGSDTIYWINITADPLGPGTWTWNDIIGLDFKFWVRNEDTKNDDAIRLDEGYVRVTYTPEGQPYISRVQRIPGMMTYGGNW